MELFDSSHTNLKGRGRMSWFGEYESPVSAAFTPAIHESTQRPLVVISGYKSTNGKGGKKLNDKFKPQDLRAIYDAFLPKNKQFLQAHERQAACQVLMKKISEQLIDFNYNEYSGFEFKLHDFLIKEMIDINQDPKQDDSGGLEVLLEQADKNNKAPRFGVPYHPVCSYSYSKSRDINYITSLNLALHTTKVDTNCSSFNSLEDFLSKDTHELKFGYYWGEVSW